MTAPKGGRKPPRKPGPPKSGGAKAGGPRRAPTRSSTGQPGRTGQTGHTRERRPPADVRGLGGDQIEGRQAVRELLLGGRRVPRALGRH